MIYITGDTHGMSADTAKLNRYHFPQQKTLTKNDVVIICGDFGYVWDNSAFDRYWQRWFANKAFTTLFIDGNHENFDLLDQYPIVNKFGGKCHQINQSLFHICRGEVLTIDDKTFFCLGGADSHDKEHRTPHQTWWPQEAITDMDIAHGLTTLSRYNYNIDYVVTHCAPTSISQFIHSSIPSPSEVQLDKIRDKIIWKRWYCGHYHQDRYVNDSIITIYNRVLLV